MPRPETTEMYATIKLFSVVAIANYRASAYRHEDVDDKQKHSTKTMNKHPATHSP